MEVLVAVLLAGLVALLIHRGLALVRDLEARSVASDEQVLTGIGVRHEIEGWLRSAFPVPIAREAVFQGVRDVDVQGAHRDRLQFLTHLPGGPARVELALEAGKGLIARIDHTASEVTPAMREDTLHLVPTATGLSIRYALDLGDSIARVDEWSSTARLPEVVEILITGDSVPKLLRAPILARVGGAH